MQADILSTGMLLLTYTRVYSLGALLTLHTVLIISGKRPIYMIINFIWCWNWAGHHLTLPHFRWKIGIQKTGDPGEFTFSTVWLLIRRLIVYVCLHYTRWPRVNIAAAALFPFRLCPIPTALCVRVRACVHVSSLSLNLQKKKSYPITWILARYPHVCNSVECSDDGEIKEMKVLCAICSPLR